MNLYLTSKERTLLEDQKNHEEICVQKYADYAKMASDPNLQEIFNRNGQAEQEHLNTLNQLLSGQIPNMNQGSSPQQQQMKQEPPPQQIQPEQTNTFQLQNNHTKNHSQDQNLCTDLLMTEKYVSGTYDTAIFEFRDPQVRNVLNHIQKEEQQHGEAIFNYMESMGMYDPQ